MARETFTRLIDDLDGGEAVETVTFGLDGLVYEIDLSAKNAKKLRNDLGAYVDHATRQPGRSLARAGMGRRRAPAAADRQQNQAIREWAQRKGIAVAARGRIKQDVVDQYHKSAGR